VRVFTGYNNRLGAKLMGFEIEPTGFEKTILSDLQENAKPIQNVQQ
jgi:hypothetical protein